MDKLTTESDFEHWIMNFLSQPHLVFNNLPPCPFAKESWIKGKVLIKEIKNNSLSVADYFLSELDHYSCQWPLEKEVIIICCDPKLISSQDLSEIVKIATEKFLSARGFIALEDHPNEIEKVNDVVLNNGLYATIFLQSFDKLKKSREILKTKGYYKNWSIDYYQDVVNEWP